MPTIEPFLRRVARHYLDLYGSDISRLTFVVPSRRAQLFFTRYLSEVAPRPIFAPSSQTINDFILSLAPDIQVLDRTALLFELWEAYRSVRGGMVESFDEFLFWGSIILRDFDLIDRHLVEARHLYRNVESYKEMKDDYAYLSDDTLEMIETFWQGFRNPRRMSAGEQADYRQSFMDFWLSLFPLYETFRERLKGLGQAYEGQIYRYVGEQATDLVATLAERLGHTEASDKEVRYVFVGLFEITPSEMRLFRAMRRRGLAEFYWDDHIRIVHDDRHPAYRMLRANIDSLGAANQRLDLPEGELTKLLPEQIRVVNSASTVTQVKALPTLLQDLGIDLQTDEREINTAIVLPSEQLLLPVASSIPPECEHLNITLGYPLSRTPISILLNRWIQLIITAQRGAYPVERILSVLTLQLITEHLPGLLYIAERIRRQKRFMLSGEWIVSTYIPSLRRQILDSSDQPSARAETLVRQLDEALPMVRLLLVPPSDAEGLLNSLGRLLDRLGELMIDKTLRDANLSCKDELDLARVPMSFDLEFLFHYKALTSRLSDLIHQHSTDMSVESVAHLLEGLAQSITIPFEGNPLRGLQIMGLLESRLLSFDTTIYLSAQEGSLPRKQQGNTLIPYTLRRGFGLPMPEWYDAAEAYRFYQSIAGCRRLVLVYGVDDPLGGKGEESRYVGQMEMLYGAEIVRSSIAISPRPADSVVEPIDKSRPEVAEALARYYSDSEDARALSASSINTYLMCPLRFYYEELLQVREEQTPEVLLAANDFGTILHASIERLYSPYVGGGRVEASYLDALLAEGSTEIERIVTELYVQTLELGTTGSSLREEMTTLAKYYIDLICIYIRGVLRYDRLCTPFTYLATEANMRLKVAISGGREIQLKGFIDRIDLCNVDGRETLRVLDYKTGSDTPEAVQIETLFHKPHKATMQTLLYCEMLLSGHQHLTDERGGVQDLAQHYPIAPGIFATRAMSRSTDTYSPYIVADGEQVLDYRAIRDKYLSGLTELLEELFDPDIPFKQTPNLLHCRYCSFVSICGR